MREVFTHPDSALAGYYESMLQDAGIETFMRNASGNNPCVAPDSYPSVYVVNDEDYEKARALLEEAQKTPASIKESWKCTACGETVPGNFDVCWQCGKERAA